MRRFIFLGAIVLCLFTPKGHSEALPGTADYIEADWQSYKDAEMEINVSDVKLPGMPMWDGKADYQIFKVKTVGLNNKNQYEDGGEMSVGVKKTEAAAFARLAKNANPPIIVRGIGLKQLQAPMGYYIEVKSFSKKQE